MRIRTLGGLTLEGSAFARPVPLLLLAYLSIEGPSKRAELGSTFFPDAADMSDSLSTALRQLEKGVEEEILRRDGEVVESLIGSDLVELWQAQAAGEPERIRQLYRGPFLAGLERARWVNPESWSDRLRDWIREARLRSASAFLTATVRKGVISYQSGAMEEAKALAAEALEAWLGHQADDDIRDGRSRFQTADLQRLHALLGLSGGEALLRFGEVAEDRDDLQPLPQPEQAVAAFLEARSTNLPLRAPGFVGRAAERAAVADAMGGQGRYVSVVGSGGMGKTTLAVQVAHDLFERGLYPDGVHLVALDDLKFANLVPVRIAQSLGVPLDPARDALDQVVEHIGQRRMLLLLDNYEHVIERSDVPERLVTACQQAGVLLTSRERLGTEREQAVVLGGLALPPEAASWTEVAESEAAGLFLQSARQRLAGFAIDPTNAAWVSDICRFAEGHPLVIDLAARLVDVLPLEALSQRIRHDIAMLEAAGGADLPQRQRSLEAVWDSSWRLLEEEDKATLRDLVVFRGGFDWAAAQEVVGADLLQLRRFVDKSLLTVSAQQRFGFHGTLVTFMSERFLASSGYPKVRARHAAYFLDLARQLLPALNRQEAAPVIARFEAEGANLRAAWEEAEDPATLLGFVEAMEMVQLRQGWWEERLALLERARQVCRAAEDAASLARLCNATADVHLQRGDVESADTALREALRRQLPEVRDEVMAETLSQLGGVHFQRRELAEAQACFEQAMAVHRELGNRGEEHRELANIGAVHYLRGEHKEAIRLWQSALTAHRRSKDLESQALLLNNLGAAYQALGDLDQALLSFEKAEETLKGLGDSIGEVAAQVNAGAVHFLKGDLDRSWRANDMALDRHQARGDRTAEALVLNNLAMIHERRGQLKPARDLLLNALRIQENDDDRVNRSATLYNLSTVTLQLGDRGRAEAYARQALELTRETGDVAAKAYALAFLADTLSLPAEGAVGEVLAAARLAEAEQAFAESATLFEQVGHTAGRVEVLAKRAEHARLNGRLDTAEALAREAMDAAAKHGFQPTMRAVLRTMAMVKAEQGEPQQARSLMDEALKLGEVQRRVDLLDDRRFLQRPSE